MSDDIFDDLAERLHTIAISKGFWSNEVDDIFIAKQCMMIVSEVTELMEAVRKDKGEGEIALETADIIIRTLDLYAGLVEAGYTTVSLDYALQEKANINKERPEKHGVQF
jgi:NTP pyrophosphatase (non-canonical NTP hydrolase)